MRYVLLTLFTLLSISCTKASSDVVDKEIRKISPKCESTLTRKFRGLHLSVTNVSPEDVIRTVELAKQNGFNTIVLSLAKWQSLALDSNSWIESSKKKKTWSREDLSRVSNHIKSVGMDLIPHLTLFSHQIVFLQPYFPELMYNSKTYDPRKGEALYGKVVPIIDEILALTGADTLHIGHDEVVGWTQRHWDKGILQPGEKQAPAELYLRSVLDLHELAKRKNIRLMMWADMLISNDEFPEMSRSGSLHNQPGGYGKPLRDQIPRDIILVDWHYLERRHNFPSIKTLLDEGFAVIGSTYTKQSTIKNFSSYSASVGACGMLATTWTEFISHKWDDVKEIIEFSGGEFSSSFPD